MLRWTVSACRQLHHRVPVGAAQALKSPAGAEWVRQGTNRPPEHVLRWRLDVGQSKLGRVTREPRIPGWASLLQPPPKHMLFSGKPAVAMLSRWQRSGAPGFPLECMSTTSYAEEMYEMTG